MRFRTPMNTIIGICEIMLRSTLPSEQASNVITIQNAGVGLLGIINDILDYSKVESGKFELNSVGYALKSLLTDVVTMFNVPLAAKPLRFVLTVSPDVPSRLVGDELRIRQILTNLLSNAVKYTKQGFIWLDVSCRRDAYKGCTLFCGWKTAAAASVHRICPIFSSASAGWTPYATGASWAQGSGLLSAIASPSSWAAASMCAVNTTRAPCSRHACPRG